MKAGKRKDSIFFITQTVSFCLATKIRSLSAADVHCDFFQRAAEATTKRDNIKEDIQ
jgi:hypothetical protein